MGEINAGDQYMVADYVYEIIAVSGTHVTVDVYDSYGRLVRTNYRARASQIKNWPYLGRSKSKLTLIKEG